MAVYTYKQLETITHHWVQENFENIPPEVRTYFFAKAFEPIQLKQRALPEGNE
jgi:hypothetical protein